MAVTTLGAMLLATWNVNSLKARMPRVIDWLGSARPDVVCLQETKLGNDAFPTDEFGELGYESVHHGEGQWNGVAILSRVGLADPVLGFGDGEEEDPDARLVTATCDGVRVSSVYVPNGREVDHEHYHYKLAWFERLRARIDSEVSPSDDVVVGGDFNVAPDDRDVWDTKSFAGSTHVTAPERAAVESLLEWGMRDVFRDRYDDDKLYSYWDYRKGMFHMHKGMRIDLILASESVADRAEFVLVDRNARKGSKPSDHAPVMAIF